MTFDIYIYVRYPLFQIDTRERVATKDSKEILCFWNLQSLNNVIVINAKVPLPQDDFSRLWLSFPLPQHDFSRLWISCSPPSGWLQQIVAILVRNGWLQQIVAILFRNGWLQQIVAILVRNGWLQQIVAILFRPFGCLAHKAFKLFDFPILWLDEKSLKIPKG